jgi:hypothetical protein
LCNAPLATSVGIPGERDELFNFTLGLALGIPGYAGAHQNTHNAIDQN